MTTTTTNKRIVIMLFSIVSLTCKRTRYVRAFGVGPTLPSSRRSLSVTSASVRPTRSSLDDDETVAVGPAPTVRHVGILGGGLAGLSVAYHLLSKANACGTTVHVTVVDRSASPGVSGASAVAGGLLHPFSPTGKIKHLALEGLHSTNALIRAAVEASDGHDDHDDIVLRERLYRLAFTEKQIKEARHTAETHPDLATFRTTRELTEELHDQQHDDDLLGGVRYEHGCRVVHVPSYLRGLWRACRTKAAVHGHGVRWEQRHVTAESSRWDAFDTVVFAAGAGQWHDGLLDQDPFPMELVRGQTVTLSDTRATTTPTEAVLCGQYVTPTPDGSSVVVGATHEYHGKLDPAAVATGLRERASRLHPRLWEDGTVTEVREGWRVQSHRSDLGRAPMVGKLSDGYHDHADAWTLSGLGNRGMIYHGVYGDLLTDAILQGDEEGVLERCPQWNWWKKRREKQQQRQS